MPAIQNIHKRVAALAATLFLFMPFCAPAQISTLNYKGNVLEVKNAADTIEILDPVTTEVMTVIENPNPIPLKLNNMNIYTVNEVEQRPSVSGDKIRRYIIQQLSEHFKRDGEYRLMLDNIIISDKGKVVYHNFNGVEKKIAIQTGHSDNGSNSGPSANGIKTARWKETDKNFSTALSTQIEKVLDKAPVYKPATVYNQPVPCLLDTRELQRPFLVKGGVIQY